MARFCPLASGSSGNSTYISRGDCAVLVDAGISYKAMAERVGSAGGDIEKIAAVALTHSHIDHISGIKTLLIKTGAPLFTTEESAEALIQKNLLHFPYFNFILLCFTSCFRNFSYLCSMIDKLYDFVNSKWYDVMNFVLCMIVSAVVALLMR